MNEALQQIQTILTPDIHAWVLILMASAFGIVIPVGIWAITEDNIAKALGALTGIIIITVGYYGAIGLENDVHALAKERAEMFLNPETEFSLQEKGGTKTLTITLPKIKEQKMTQVMGKEIPTTVILREEKSYSIGGGYLEELLTSNIQLSGGQSLAEKIVKNP